jgi:hypothetical protein
MPIGRGPTRLIRDVRFRRGDPESVADLAASKRCPRR